MSSPKQPDPARRSERARQAIFDAVGDLVPERGLAATSIDQVAERAGVGKQTIYRWWPNKSALLLAYARDRARPVAEPDTGTLDGDLRQLAEDLVETLGTSPAGRVCAELLGAVEADPAFAEAFRETFVSGRRATVVTVLGRWRDLGEVRGDIDLEVAADLLYGPIWYRRLVQRGDLDRSFADSLVELTVDAVKA